MIRKILVPDTISTLNPIDGIEISIYPSGQPIPEKDRDAEGIVLWGMSNEQIRILPTELPGLRFIQLLSAGYDAVQDVQFHPDAVLASGKSLHDAPVAEHTLALVLAAARRLNLMVRAQIGHRWASELGGMQQEPSPGSFSTLREARVTIWGYGNIGKTIAGFVQQLGASVRGIATCPRKENGINVVAASQCNEVLEETDVLIAVLPYSPKTHHMIGQKQFASLPSHAWFVNVGRGATVDQSALIEALENGELGGAALDVVDPEPLPIDSPLWDLPNVIISPHAAGGRPLGAHALIKRNLLAWQNGQELKNQINIRKETQ